MKKMTMNELQLVNGGILDDMIGIAHDITTIIREGFEYNENNTENTSSDNHSGGREGTW